MASIFKPTYTVTDRKTGRKVRRKVSKWYGRFRNADGEIERVPLCRDKAAAQVMLNERVRREDRKAAGLVDRFEDHRRRPLSEHLDEFEAHLRSKGNVERYVMTTSSRLRALFAGCGFRQLSELDADSVGRWLAGERSAGRFGVATSNQYVVACRQFGGWLVRSRRLPENPFAHLAKLNADVDVRRERRALSADELARLIAAAESSAATFGKSELRAFRRLTGPDRAMLYRVAAFTGLRANELASLSKSSFDFRSDPPTVTVEAGYSKRRRKDVLPLHADLVEALAKWFAERRAGENRDAPLWPGTWTGKAAEMLRGDLQAARAKWLDECGDDGEARHSRERTDFLCPEDDAGLVVDFHALRHSFISHLASAGVHPKTAQELARHSTITLTMDRYAHLGHADLAGALNTLPKLGDGGRPLAPLVLPLAQKADFACPDVSACDLLENSEAGEDGSRKPSNCQQLDAVCRNVSTTDRKWGRWDSNPQPTDYESAQNCEILGENVVFSAGAAPRTAVDAEIGPRDTELERLIAVWPALPEAVRRSIVELIATHAGKHGGTA